MRMPLQSGTELINPFKLLERVGARAGFHIADLGCGALGHFVFPASQLVGPEGMVYAVDIQRSVLAQIEKGTRDEQIFNVRTVWSDIDVLGATRIPEGSLDLTLVANNLWLSQNRPQLVMEAARLTRPGGRIVVVEWIAGKSPIGPPPDRRISADGAKAIFASPLMSFLGEFEAGPYHYGLMYERTERVLGGWA